MLNKLVIRVIFITIIIFSFTTLKAATQDENKSQAMNEALAKLETGPAREYRQKLEERITEEKPEEKLPNELDSFVRFVPSRKVEAMSGKVEMIQSESEYSYELKAFGKLPVEFSVTSEYIGIENTTEVELPAHLTGVIFGLETTLPFFKFKDTYFRLGLDPAFYSDDWNFRTSAFRIPSRYFLIHQPNSRWTFILGVAVYPDFENKVWPILGFIYKPNDRLEFNIIPQRPNITYAFNNKISVFLEGDISYSEFEVTKDNLKNVVLKYREAHLGSGLNYKFNKFMQVFLSAGGMFNRSLKYKDSLGKVKIKDGLYTEFRLEVKF